MASLAICRQISLPSYSIGELLLPGEYSNLAAIEGMSGSIGTMTK